jgi:DNA-binding transcriptional MerR regulator
MMGMTSYSIGQLAKHAEVPTTTVRYYERRGLLTPEKRSGGNYRLYGEASLERLRFIKAAQGAGFTLSDIDALLDLRDNTDSPNRQVQHLIDERLGEIGEQIQHLQQVEKALRQWRGRCAQAERDGRCEVLEALIGSCCDQRESKRSGR